MSFSMPAVLFAGGKSTRMHQDKALLPFGGFASLSAFQYHKLTTLFERVYLSAKTNKFDFDCQVICDLYGQSSPLVGIVSVFETLEVDEVFILSVDAPFVDAKTINTILAHAQPSDDAIVAQSPSGIQPLCGLYRRSILPLAHQQLEAQNHKLHTLLTLAQTRTVYFEEDQPFTNLNLPSDYQEALKLSQGDV